MSRVVVLGTGTGVGKTYVTAALARALAASGRVVQAVKPVETGLQADAASDAETLSAASNAKTAPTPHPLFGFPDPITPWLAAEKAGAPPPSLPAIQQWVHASEAALRYVAIHVVETAGGVFSPLSPTATNFELARALEPCRWVLVAADSLGVLHDVTATLTAMRARGRTPDHVVLSAARVPDASTGTNAHALRTLGICDAVAELSRSELDLSRLVAALLSDG